VVHLIAATPKFPPFQESKRPGIKELRIITIDME
jgi:hypothetical protein